MNLYGYVRNHAPFGIDPAGLQTTFLDHEDCPGGAPPGWSPVTVIISEIIANTGPMRLKHTIEVIDARGLWPWALEGITDALDDLYPWNETTPWGFAADSLNIVLTAVSATAACGSAGLLPSSGGGIVPPGIVGGTGPGGLPVKPVPPSVGAPHTPDQRALKELVEEATDNGRKPLNGPDASIVVDWGDEVQYPGFRVGPNDVGGLHGPGPHIHVPGVGNDHIGVPPGWQPPFWMPGQGS